MGIEPSRKTVRGTVSPSIMLNCIESDLIFIFNILFLRFELTGINFSAAIGCGCFSNEDTNLFVGVENINQRVRHMIELNRYYR